MISLISNLEVVIHKPLTEIATSFCIGLRFLSVKVEIGAIKRCCQSDWLHLKTRNVAFVTGYK